MAGAFRSAPLGNCSDSVQAERFEIILVEPEVVRGLVQHRDPDLLGEGIEVVRGALEVGLEQPDVRDARLAPRNHSAR